MVLNELSEKIIGCYYAVYNGLGFGFLEKVYENAIAIELRTNGLVVVQQQSMSISYRGIVVGEYQADIIVNNRVILELKTSDNTHHTHEAQLIHYLKATSKPLGLLLYFGNKAIVRRVLNIKESVESV